MQMFLYPPPVPKLRAWALEIASGQGWNSASATYSLNLSNAHFPPLQDRGYVRIYLIYLRGQKDELESLVPSPASTRGLFPLWRYPAQPLPPSVTEHLHPSLTLPSSGSEDNITQINIAATTQSYFQSSRQAEGSCSRTGGSRGCHYFIVIFQQPCPLAPVV